MDKTSYALGMSIAHNMISSGVTELNFDDFALAIKDMFADKEPAVPFSEASKILQDYFTKIEEQKAAEAAEMGAKMKEEGEAFLKVNAIKPDVVTLKSGLQYKVITNGTGKKPTRSSSVQCHYEGKLVDGTVFDSSYQRGEPAVFGVTQVIQGWTEALQLMNEGSVWELYLPYNLAYGERGAGASIPPYATLIFKVELIKVI